MQRIMVATDGSAGADRAVDFAAQLAHGLGAELLILTVAGAFAADEMRRLAQAEQDIGSALDNAAEQLVRAAEARVAHIASLRTRCSFVWGDPAQAIIAEAERAAAELIVVGRRGRGQLAGLLLGSVSQKLTSLARCPVLVVP